MLNNVKSLPPFVPKWAPKCYILYREGFFEKNKKGKLCEVPNDIKKDNINHLKSHENHPTEPRTRNGVPIVTGRKRETFLSVSTWHSTRDRTLLPRREDKKTETL
jgi:hypothetical protein